MSDKPAFTLDREQITFRMTPELEELADRFVSLCPKDVPWQHLEDIIALMEHLCTLPYSVDLERAVDVLKTACQSHDFDLFFQVVRQRQRRPVARPTAGFWRGQVAKGAFA